MKTEDTRKLVEKFTAARIVYDYDRVYELLADDSEVHFPQSVPIKGTSGRENVARALTGGAAGQLIDTSTMSVDVKGILADGDVAVVRQVVKCVTPNGRDYENNYCWVITCRDGKVAKLEEFADTLYAARIFGWVPE